MQATESNAALFTKMHQYHTLGLANIATATQIHRTLVELLQKIILELSIQAATLTDKLATVQSQNARLKNRYIVQPRPSTAIRRPSIQPHPIITQSKTAMSIQGADTNSTLADIAHFTGTR